jgi:hypothetical protein
MRPTVRFITIIIVLDTLLIAAPSGPRAASAAAILWTPPLRGNLATGSAAECVVFWTDKKATKATASIVVDIIRGDTGGVIATASAAGPFSPGTQMAAAFADNTDDYAIVCRITVDGASKSKVRAVLELFSGLTGVPAAAVPLVK